MYYQKYFEGSVPASSGYTVQYCPVPNTKQPSSEIVGNSSGCVLNKLTVIGNAIASTLSDCGMDARYVPETGYLYFDYANSDIGVFITSGTSTSGKDQVTYKGSYSTGTYIDDNSTDYTSADATTFSNRGFDANGTSAANYKFCITVRGDVESMFTVYIGKYTAPTDMTHMFTVYFGVDKRDNSAVFGTYFRSPTSSIIWKKSSDMRPVISTTALTPATRLTMYEDNIVLIEQYMTDAGFITMDKVYIDPGFNTSGEFYEIDGETYFCYTPYFIKCVTDVEPTAED